MIAIVDYGLGNLKSIQNMLSHIGVKSSISNHPVAIRESSKLILPGVGAFDSGIINLQKAKLIELLNEEVLIKKKPILGICLGMQLMTRLSEEGKERGLSWFNAQTRRLAFSDEQRLKVPHMGWNTAIPKSSSTIFNGLEKENRFYFVHSYFVECLDPNDILATCDYGSEFSCAIAKENIYGVQFHPEKSHKFGMKLLKNFAELQSHA